MASFLTDLVKPYVEKLINGAITESSYICCFTCIAKDFEEEKARLEVERTTFKQRVDVAKREGQDVQGNALSWEEEAEKLIQEDTKTKQKCFFGFCYHCIWRYKRGKELANKKEEIKKMTETGRELAIGLPARLPDVERYSSQYFIPFKSRESKYKELLDSLNDDNNYIVGLQGMGGTGKTTLVKEVGKKLKQSKQFTQVVDTTVSFSPNIKKIQDDIAGPLGLKFDDCSESDRSKKLWSRLTNGEKILIILDDVWGDIDFDEIGIPQSDNCKGCRVFVTTRNLQVCYKLGCNTTIQLDLLTEEDAWIMFQRHAGLSEVSTKNLLDRGRKIANECKRLPVAIAAIASSLKGEQCQENWDVALNSLQKHISIGGVGDDLVDIYKCLKFSYDYLKDKNTKELFLLCSVFQEDKIISIEILTRLGIGVGLFEEGYEKYNIARNLIVVAKNKLLDSCLLLKAYQYREEVKMHDLVREVAQWIANKDQILVVDFSTKNKKPLVGRDDNIKYLSFHGNSMDLCSFKFDGSKLKILIFIMDKGFFGDVPVSFFENIAGLRVLNLIAPGYQQTMPLPQSIWLLMNLRSLIIEYANLGDISVLGSLQSLETLDLKDCQIDKLPEEIAKLKELRLLNLDCCRIKSNNPFEVIQKCTFLEELYFSDSFNDFCREITFPAALERYRLTVTFHWMDTSVSKCVSLKSDCLSEATFKHVMQTAESLKLNRIKKGWKNIMPEIVPIDQGMNDVISLHLEDDSQLQCLVYTKHIGSDQVPNVFSKLVVLKLIGMNNLKELCNGPISLDSMNSLKELTIMSCGNLRSLFKGNLNLCNLKTVKIEKCSTLVSVFHLSPSGSPPLLEELNISECEQLKNIFTYERRIDDAIEVDGDNDNNKSCNSLFSKLKVVKIDHCDKLTYIFDQEVNLDSLIKLKLNNVPHFKDIFPNSDQSKPQTQLQLQVEPIKSNIFSWSHICCYRYKLKGTTTSTIPSVVSEEQPQVCSISTETSSYCFSLWERAQCLSRLSHIMCNIKVIKLVKVSNIKSVFMLSIAQKMSLESLTIYNCDELEHIVVDIGDGSGGNELGIVFPKLKELNVQYCSKLEYIFGHINASDDYDQNNNEIQIQLHFPALKCLKLVKLQSLISMCPKQYHTTFPPLIELEVGECSQVDVKSIGDFTFLISTSRYQDSTTIKQFNGNMEHFLALERLNVYESNVESILCLNEESDRKINLGLQNISLINLPMMICLFVGPNKNAFVLKNLKKIVISRCEKLEIVFSTSVLRCLSQLSHLKIEECNELKHIIEDDIGNEIMSNSVSLSSKTCFPMLITLTVVKCNKLKSVFPIFMSKELPKLELMIIAEADELEDIFKSLGGDDQIVEIPKLKVVAFVNLPRLCHVPGIPFQAVPCRLVQNCKELSMTSSEVRFVDSLITQIDGIDGGMFHYLMRLSEQLQKITPKGSEFACLFNKNPRSKATKYFGTEIEVQVASEHMELISEQSTSQQHSLVKIDTTIKLSQLEGSMSTIPETRNVAPIHVDHKQKEYGDGQIDNIPFPVSTTECLNIEDVNLGDSHQTTQTNNQVSLNDDAFMQVSSTIQQPFPKDDEIIVSGLGMPSVENSPTNSQELMNEQSMHQQRLKNQERPLGEIDAIIKSSQGVEGGAKLTNANTVISSTHLELEQNVDVRDIQETIKTNDDQVVAIEEQFPKDDEFRLLESKPSLKNSLPLHLEFETRSMPIEGNNPSRIKENLSSPSFVIWELEQLVSENYLDYENLSLLTDFLVKHPSVLLKDISLGNRYKGYAYICLAELLQFLQTHSVLDVLGSSRSKFVKLLQDVSNFGFDKDWLDSVKRRTLFSDVQVSQDALQKLLESKKQVSKEVEVLRMKIDIFNHHVEDLKHQLTLSEAVLESIIEQEAQVLETKAALSAPLGY